MNKYQLYINFKHDKKLVNTAASKAIVDCTTLLSRLGYQDFTITNASATNKTYLFTIFTALIGFFSHIKSRSMVAVQYPLLSGNNQFKYFIKVLKLKRAKIFCIIHDLESIRYQDSERLTRKEIANLNAYDCIIVHNDIMKEWLQQKGVKKPMVTLHVFDYLSDTSKLIKREESSNDLKRDKNEVVYAGNLEKSAFIYDFNKIEGWKLRAYGPSFDTTRGEKATNLHWMGQFSPDEIVNKLDGDFGLIWDGIDVEKLDEGLGNYLRFNNPHKFSLYLAAGLPVVAPRDSAIGSFIKAYQLGLLIDSLIDLNNLHVNEEMYLVWKNNVKLIGEKIKDGVFFTESIKTTENILV